ncbi:Pycsar system effector family protein [Flavobacterium antarcticum]|uniref:Pycsar system effector family protein n=1 Tax=Flavobacterium antarcticum TaxID=271155 RepID=UPI0003B6DAE2|nr:Pycsar system effector family protein [Flavobacterium antarcticum]
MSIVQKTEDFVNQLFKDNLSLDYTYHNFNHTLNVVKSARLLLDAENCSADETEIALLAAWFHDTGYTKGCEKHEELSIEIATTFLKEQHYDASKIELISQLIRKTELHQEPQTKLEKIIRDADWAHFGNPDYFKYCNLLRFEFGTTRKMKFTDLEWSYENQKFFQDSHQFYTDYAKENWQPIKEKNAEQLQKNITVLEQKKQDKKSTKSLLNKKKLDKIDVPERGIDTMFRVTLNNHTKLSQIADSKANILLSVNAIIISIALSTLIPKLDSARNAHLVIPTFIMLFFSVISIIFAILSTRPKVSTGSFTRKDIDERKVNLLFFGNFYKMPLEEYTWAMKELMKDKDYLYESMIKDLYYLGLVLNRKYKLLRITYTIFMIGILISVAAFVIAFKNL